MNAQQEMVAVVQTGRAQLLQEPFLDGGVLLPGNYYPAERHPVYAYLAQLGSKVSRDGMAYRLTAAARLLSQGQAEALTLPWHQVTYVHVLAVRSKLAETKAPRTVNVTLASIRGVAKECWRLGYMSHEDFERIREVKDCGGYRLPAGRMLEPHELETLFQSCLMDKRKDTGARDAALLACLYGLGLRQSEVVGLDAEDYDRPTGVVKVLHGKGNKQRLLYATGATAEAINAWLDIRGELPGPLFLNLHHRAWELSDKRRRISSRAIWMIINRRSQKEGMEKFSPHDLRRTFISNLLDIGADLSTVAALVGHSNITITAIYDRRGERAKQKTIALLDVPYKRPAE